jgi:Peptidase family M1 domain/Peptidase M1 N-terminal domain
MSGRLIGVMVAVCIGSGIVAAPAVAGGFGGFGPGAPGIGDPYFPLDGNGGYDVADYELDVDYEPATDVLSGVASIRARATQNLSRFNLDLVGLTVRAVFVDGRRATWSRDEGELTVTPQRPLRKHERFTTVVVYDGVPEPVGDPQIGISGFIHTDDGTLVAGQPDVAATWHPVNDHPADKASYTFRITVPQGLEAVANGELESRRTSRGRTTWVWEADEPMAPYLATATIGEFDLRAYREDGIRYWDAIDPDLLVPPQPRTGEQFAISQKAEQSYKRLTRTIDVPAGGGELSFWVTRDTEANWDHFFVEAHPVGSDDWTTLRDLNGNNSQDTGFVCPYWLGLHPFLEHYQTENPNGACSPSGTTGDWWAASGASGGYEQWRVDLSPYAGGQVEVSLSYASDDLFQLPGVVVDDIVGPGGAGSTSFEDDGDTMDGWTVPGPPEGSIPNENDWIVGTAEDTPPTTGEIAEGSFARQPEIIEFLSERFGPYPFREAGGIVDDADDIGFALENQTRPVYSKAFFFSPESGDSVVVHELAHQWYGDSLALALWQDIWLNEGFATYAEWMWSGREGLGTEQEIFDANASRPADDPFWTVVIGDPGPDALFDSAVYDRGAMTLHALRLEVGDRDFFRILRVWAQSREGGNVATPEFVELAERISDEVLDDLFETWLFTPAKPAGIEPAEARVQAESRAVERPRAGSPAKGGYPAAR